LGNVTQKTLTSLINNKQKIFILLIGTVFFFAVCGSIINCDYDYLAFSKFKTYEEKIIFMNRLNKFKLESLKVISFIDYVNSPAQLRYLFMILIETEFRQTIVYLFIPTLTLALYLTLSLESFFLYNPGDLFVAYLISGFSYIFMHPSELFIKVPLDRVAETKEFLLALSKADKFNIAFQWVISEQCIHLDRILVN